MKNCDNSWGRYNINIIFIFFQKKFENPSKSFWKKVFESTLTYCKFWNKTNECFDLERIRYLKTMLKITQIFSLTEKKRESKQRSYLCFGRYCAVSTYHRQYLLKLFKFSETNVADLPSVVWPKILVNLNPFSEIGKSEINDHTYIMKDPRKKRSFSKKRKTVVFTSEITVFFNCRGFIPANLYF